MSISPLQSSSFGIPLTQQSGAASGIGGMPSFSPSNTAGDSIGQSSGGQSASQQIEQELQMLIQLLMQLIQAMAQSSGGAVGGSGDQGQGQGGGQPQQAQQPQAGGDSFQPQSNTGGTAPQQSQQPGWNTSPQSSGSSGSGDVADAAQSGGTGTTTGTGSAGATGSGSSASGTGLVANTYDNVTTDTTGLVTKGTHPLRPVPLNGGEHKEAPTSVADINKIIKDIDPTLLTNPDQKGEGALKGLPRGKMFEAAGKATGIDPKILYADSQVETGDNKNKRILEPNNINPIQTAPGVWPTTNNAATNLFTGAYVMKDYINRAGGNLKEGLNAYNTGNVSPSEKGFADGYAGYYEGVMSAYGRVQAAIKDPSIVGPGQGGNVDPATQI